LKTSQLNIEQLIDKCLLQDQEAQLEIYDRYYKAMYNIAYRILKNNAEAEDIMQEAFLKAFTKLNTLEKSTMFGAWLKRIVINLSIGALKKESKMPKVPVNEVEFCLSENDEFKDAEINISKTNELLQGLNKLKDSYRLVLSLHFIEGYDYKEISEIMNVTQGNVRTLISRGKESLRKKLQVI